MKLVPLCTMTHRQTEYVSSGPLPGGDSIGFVLAEGEVTGERLAGTTKRHNFAYHRADGVNLPNTQGVIATHDGATVFFEIHGLSPLPRPGTTVRDAFAGIMFRTADPRYAWLNSVYGVCEGRYAGGPVAGYDIYECRSDDA